MTPRPGIFFKAAFRTHIVLVASVVCLSVLTGCSDGPVTQSAPVTSAATPAASGPGAAPVAPEGTLAPEVAPSPSVEVEPEAADPLTAVVPSAAEPAWCGPVVGFLLAEDTIDLDNVQMAQQARSLSNMPALPSDVALLMEKSALLYETGNGNMDDSPEGNVLRGEVAAGLSGLHVDPDDICADTFRAASS